MWLAPMKSGEPIECPPPPPYFLFFPVSPAPSRKDFFCDCDALSRSSDDSGCCKWEDLRWFSVD